MLSKVRVHMKASFLLLRFYLWIVYGVVAINLIVTSIVNLSIGSNDPQISVGNSLTVFLIFIAIVLPVGYFKRFINLGATRKDYYARNLYYFRRSPPSTSRTVPRNKCIVYEIMHCFGDIFRLSDPTCWHILRKLVECSGSVFFGQPIPPRGIKTTPVNWHLHEEAQAQEPD